MPGFVPAFSIMASGRTTSVPSFRVVAGIPFMGSLSNFKVLLIQVIRPGMNGAEYP